MKQKERGEIGREGNGGEKDPRVNLKMFFRIAYVWSAASLATTISDDVTDNTAMDVSGGRMKGSAVFLSSLFAVIYTTAVSSGAPGLMYFLYTVVFSICS